MPSKNHKKTNVRDIGGEFGLIKRIGKKARLFSKDVLVGIGDDAAVLKDGKRFLLFTTDMLVEDDHFSLKYSSPEQVGMKAIEVNVSDIAAMGGVPKHAVISLALPKHISVGFVDGLYRGINRTAKKYSVDVIGGDITHSREIVINVAMLGLVERENLCLRSNAKVNDLICVSGDLGKSAAGLQLLLENKKGSSVKPHLEPKARLSFARKVARYANAMEDVSDGLAQEVRNICYASNVGALIYKERIPLSKATIEDAKKTGKSPYDFALYGGEDFELVFTINKNKLGLLKRKIKGVYVVGRILAKRDGIYLVDKNKKIKLGRGYDHFK
jgi:thiamine-monophosphate kinase